VTRVRAILYWSVPSILCLALYWYGFKSWFRADDFAWLSVARTIHSFPDLMRALFAPRAQGTIRPWSERCFFIIGYDLFGLQPLPFRIVVFATQFANLALLAEIGTRLTGKRAAGFWAAIFWVANSALAEVLDWACVYNEVLCAFFLLLAFYFLLRYIETGNARHNTWQWVVYLLGFGALELNVVYPVLAATYTRLCAPKYFRRTLPLFLPAAAFAILHGLVAPIPKTGPYAMHLDASILQSLLALWSWSLSAVFLRNAIRIPSWFLPGGVAVLSAALLVFAVRQTVGRRWLAVFGLVWYFVVIAPVAPLRDHLAGYYIYLPLIGLCWLGGWAFAAGWGGGWAARSTAVALAALYLFMTLPRTWAATQWIYRVSGRAERLVKGVAWAHERHPNSAILLYGVDTELFLNAVKDHPFPLVGADQVYLAPGSERTIHAPVDLYMLSADVTEQALERDQLEVYDATRPYLRNITQLYRTMPRESGLPSRVDVSSPLMAYLLGPGWYKNEGNHRWMARRASLRIAAPGAAGQQLHLSGYCPEEQLRGGPLRVTVAINGEPAGAGEIRENSFELAFPVPASALGKPDMQVAVEAGRTFRVGSDQRELSLVFGVFEVR